MIKYTMVAVAIMLTAPACLSADYSGSYMCAEEFGGGLRYDPTAERWMSTTFKPAGRFVIKANKLGERPWYEGSDLIVSDYQVNVGVFGEPDSVECTPVRGGAVSMFGSTMSCEASLTSYRINLEAMRFISSYPFGYFDGEDNNKNTPAMMGGTCAKID